MTNAVMRDPPLERATRRVRSWRDGMKTCVLRIGNLVVSVPCALGWGFNHRPEPGSERVSENASSATATESTAPAQPPQAMTFAGP